MHCIALLCIALIVSKSGLLICPGAHDVESSLQSYYYVFISSSSVTGKQLKTQHGSRLVYIACLIEEMLTLIADRHAILHVFILKFFFVAKYRFSVNLTGRWL